MADLGHQMTDKELEQLERKIHRTYKEAYKEMQDKVDAYFDKLKDRDKEQQALLETGKITKKQYEEWRLTQYARGERYRKLRDEFARRMNEANKVAAAYVNDTTPGIYSLNANYMAYNIEQSGAGVDFNLIQEQAVRRLIVEEPELFHRPAIDTPLDVVWNQRKLTDNLTAGILMGESTRQIADRFQKVTDMNRTSALRNARTAVTGAQNAGRQATYDRAREMGLKLDERWLSTKDGVTRDSHRVMDGKPKDKDGYFHTPLGSIMRYPGDMQNGKAADVYNCRCTTSTKDALEAEPTMMRARDPVTGRNELVQDMSYHEWYEWKLEQYGEDTIQLAELKIKHKNADQKQFENYRSVLGKNAPKTFEDFQTLKYNDSEKWGNLKGLYRYMNENPESNKSFYEANKMLQELRESNQVRAKGIIVKPPVNIKIHTCNNHARDRLEERGLSQETAQHIVDNAIFALKQRNGEVFAFYTQDGFAAVNIAGELQSTGNLDEKGKILFKEMIEHVR